MQPGACQKSVYLERTMKKWLAKLETMAMAVAFAEAGEWDYAQEIMEKEKRKKLFMDQKARKNMDKRPRMRV